MSSEERARKTIDALLEKAGWHVCDMKDANIHAARGVAIREFSLKTGHGEADYLFYIDGQAAGVIEAKKEGFTLSGVATQSEKYTKGLPDSLPAWRKPLPFAYESTGVETNFTNGLDPNPRARCTFAFHRPETLATLLDSVPRNTAAERSHDLGGTFLAKLRAMPKLVEGGLWPAQLTAIRNLEESLKTNRPRALIQMATGSGKT